MLSTLCVVFELEDVKQRADLVSKKTCLSPVMGWQAENESSSLEKASLEQESSH